MDFFTTDLEGITRMSPGVVERREILASVEGARDLAHPEVFLTSRDGIAIGYRTGGILTWEEQGSVRQTLRDVDLNRAAEVWTWLASGDTTALQSLPWEAVASEDTLV
jgi:hypothetical protein